MEPQRVKRLDALESIRGVAAVFVVIYHTAYQPLRPFPPEWDAWMVPWGLYALPMFFVLSAFVLWYGYVDDDGHIRGGPLHFYRRRFFRIAPLYYVLLAIHLLFIWDFALAKPGIPSALTFTYSLVPGHHAGIVFASWSIGVEVVYYAIMPLLALVVRRWWAALALFVAAVPLAAHTGRDVVGVRRMDELNHWTIAQSDAYSSLGFNALFFAAGLLAVFAFLRSAQLDEARRYRLGQIALIAAVVAFAVLGWLGANEPFAHRPIWALALAAMVFGLATSPPTFMLHPTVRWLGARSFSIYLLHGPVIFFLERSGGLDQIYRFAGPLGFPAAALVVLALVLPLSAVTYRWIEVPGMRLGGHGALRLSRRQA